MRVGRWLATLMLSTLTSCGGGSVSVGLNFDSGGLRFILWTGNFNGDLILDADNQRFAFYRDNGCLYNYQTGRSNNSFCLSHGDDLVQYQGFFIRIANIRSTTGICVTAFVDEATARFIDIELDGSGREVIVVTLVQPILCVV